MKLTATLNVTALTHERGQRHDQADASIRVEALACTKPLTFELAFNVPIAQPIQIGQAISVDITIPDETPPK